MSTSTLTPPAATESVAPVQARIGWRGPVLYGLLAVITLVLGVTRPGDAQTRFLVSRSGDFVTIPDFAVPSRLTILLLAGVVNISMLLLAALAAG